MKEDTQHNKIPKNKNKSNQKLIHIYHIPSHRTASLNLNLNLNLSVESR